MLDYEIQKEVELRGFEFKLDFDKYLETTYQVIDKGVVIQQSKNEYVILSFLEGIDYGN